MSPVTRALVAIVCLTLGTFGLLAPPAAATGPMLWPWLGWLALSVLVFVTGLLHGLEAAMAWLDGLVSRGAERHERDTEP